MPIRLWYVRAFERCSIYRSLLDVLVDPISNLPLEVQEHRSETGGTIVEGILHSPDGRSYTITGGIPRFVLTEDCGQRQTERSFGYQWKQREAYDSKSSKDFSREWLVRRYGFASGLEMQRYFAERQCILDAGCGGGYSASLWLDSGWWGAGTAQWYGADISEAIDVAQERLTGIPGLHFVQADVCQLPFAEKTFDVIFSEGVLHHTPSTERALKSLVPLLRRGGEIMFYVYRKKGPIREFTDDYIREIMSVLTPQQAWDKLRPLTKLGQALAELHAEVEVKEDIPYLGIKAGRYDAQRLIYWNFAKMFWNDNLSFDENHLQNFDWYSPRYAFRQTEEEVRRWCAESGLSIFYFNTEEAGFTVRAVKD
jgi:arsenite methyltransferase